MTMTNDEGNGDRVFVKMMIRHSVYYFAKVIQSKQANSHAVLTKKTVSGKIKLRRDAAFLSKSKKVRPTTDKASPDYTSAK